MLFQNFIRLKNFIDLSQLLIWVHHFNQDSDNLNQIKEFKNLKYPTIYK